jgi:hypothetical protein
VTEGVAGFVFVDGGRTAGSDLHGSAGIGLQLHDRRSLSSRAWLAATDEGGIGVSLRFEPGFSSRGREVVR